MAEIGSTSYHYEWVCAEIAKSSKSECKGCEKFIDRDEVRLAHVIYFDPDFLYFNKRWFHVKCW